MFLFFFEKACNRLSFVPHKTGNNGENLGDMKIKIAASVTRLLFHLSPLTTRTSLKVLHFKPVHVCLNLCTKRHEISTIPPQCEICKGFES